MTTLSICSIDLLLLDLFYLNSPGQSYELICLLLFISRCHFEIQASDHEKEVEEVKHIISVMENNYERNYFEIQTRHEQEIQFLMAQLRHSAASRGNGSR